MESMYSELKSRSSKNHDSKKVAAYIKIIRNTKNPQLQKSAKYELFFQLSRIFIKAINNFNSLTKNVPAHKILHSNDDIALECFLVMDKCIQNVDLSKIKMFYFYLNSSLNRAIYRIFENEYQKRFNIIDNTEENEFLINNRGYIHHFDFSEIDLTNFTPIEVKIIEFKVRGGKLVHFLKKHHLKKDMYHQLFDQLKDKLKKIYKDEQFFDPKPECD